METVQLGRTGLRVTRTAFGVLPLQRTERAEAARILRRAFEAGINFYDTARAYSDSEEKIGFAFADVREHLILATKSGAHTRAGLLADLETSLRHLRTDHVDILQLHNPETLPDPADPESSCSGAVEAQRQGKTRFIGITNHGLERALAAAGSGLYDTVQFPLNTLSSERDLSLIERCREHDVGVIAMKALSGGLITQVRAAFAYLRQFPNVVPIWGVQRMRELEEILELDAEAPLLDAELRAVIERDRAELAGEFCRACGYCLPCPADIPIPMAARMGLLLRRMPYRQFLSAEWQGKMRRIRDCTACGHCREHCPYGLDPPALLQKMLREYDEFCARGDVS